MTASTTERTERRKLLCMVPTLPNQVRRNSIPRFATPARSGLRRCAIKLAWQTSFILLVATAFGRPTATFAQQPHVVNKLTRDAAPAVSTGTDTKLAGLRRGLPPRSVDELLAVQRRIQQLMPKIMPATVAIQVGRANGSGVIIDAEGHVLTAAHVAGQPGRVALVHLTDGRTVRGMTLGMNQELDAGMIRIDEQGPWPHATLGVSAPVGEGQWCLATGHPGGYDRSRPPVLRWGRILKAEPAAILTDCTLVGGDSGGPLFDLDGNVIAIHSRIGKNLTINVHVPVDPFRESWDRFLTGEIWGLLDEQHAQADSPSPRERDRRSPAETDGAQDRAWLGVVESPQSIEALVQNVVPDSPAAQAGLQAGDIVETLDGNPIANFGELQQAVRARQAGEQVRLEIRRGAERYELNVRLGRRLRDTSE